MVPATQLISSTPVLLLWLLAATATSSATDYYDFSDGQNYGGEGDNEAPIYEKPLPPYDGEVSMPLLIAVEAVVSCKNGSKYLPLKGVVARITCMALNEKGNEMSPFSFSSFPSDEHGYLLGTLSAWKVKGKVIRECKAFLPPSSPCEDCKYLTNINSSGLGAPLRSFRILTHKKMKLYSVGPFFYSSQPNAYPVPDAY